jgi:hypothetical protein
VTQEHLHVSAHIGHITRSGFLGQRGQAQLITQLTHISHSMVLKIQRKIEILVSIFLKKYGHASDDLLAMRR